MSIENPQEGKLKIMFIGHKMQGKSTLNGQLLFQMNRSMFDEQFIKMFQQDTRNYAYFLRALPKYFKDFNALIKGLFHEEERKDRMTTEIYINEWVQEHGSKRILSIDTPGNKHYLTEWIKGLIIADIAIFVVSAVENQYQEALSVDSETGRNLLLILKTFNYQSVIFCINFMDDPSVKWQEAQFKKVKKFIEDILDSEQIYFKNRLFIPTSALLGDNVTEISKNMEWYDGLSLFDTIQKISSKMKSDKSRIRILVGNEKEITIKNRKTPVVFGIVESGTVSKKTTRLVIYPLGKMIDVRFFDMSGQELDEVQTDEYTYVQFLAPNLDLKTLNGSVIGLEDEPPITAADFQAFLLVFGKDLRNGESYTFFFNNKSYTCKIVICSKFFYKIKAEASGEEQLIKVSQQDAQVVTSIIPARTLTEVTMKIVDGKIAFESYDTNKNSSLCRFFMKQGKEIIAIGLITRGVPRSDG
nr:GTP-binding protein [Candidatus Sigynarchaeota archaeon]